MFSNFLLENRAINEVMSKNEAEPERPQTIWRVRVACWISKTTCEKSTPAPVHPHPPPHTHTHKCVTLIAFSIAAMVS
jgi:hypothetical protein